MIFNKIIMIQRIQSFYLFLSSVFYFSYWYFGMEWFKKGLSIINDIYSNNLYFVFDIISYIPLIISAICFFTILLFKNRQMQVRMSYSALYISLFMCVFSGFYFYITLNGLIEIMPSTTLEILLYSAILNPFICSFLIYLAIKSIKNDDELVNSLDRIR